MSPTALPDREARLAAKLRENLRRRKVQARTLDGAAPASGPPEPGDSAATLSKPDPSR